MVKKLNLAESRRWSEDNPIDPSKVSWKGLTRFQNLAELDVSSCSEAAPFLEEMLKINAENLEVLKMGNCQLSRPSKDKKMWARLKDKENAPKEKEYDPGDPSFPDRCLQILAKDGKKLRELDLSHLEISGASLDVLFFNEFIYNLSFGFFCPLGCVKASGIEKHKQVNIRKYGPAYVFRFARAFTLAQRAKKLKTQVYKNLQVLSLAILAAA